MSQENWALTYDMSCLFPVEFTDAEGNVWNCDSDDECWIYFEDSHEACDDSWNCYSPEEAIAVYFGEDTEESWSEWVSEEENQRSESEFEWDDDFEVPDSDWFNEFATDVEIDTFFPDQYTDDNGTLWSCDYDEWCVYYDEPLEQYCDEQECFTFDDTV
jgi:hypothetical protein